jgi:hypothetical protein
MTPIHLIGDIYAADVPEDASAIETHVSGGIQKIVFSSKLQDPAQCGGDMISLPPGNWQIICTTKEVTNANLAEIYGYPFIGDDYAQGTLHALLASKGLDPNKSLIIKKVS